MLSLVLLGSITFVTASSASSCYTGSYRVAIPPFNGCSGFRNCDIGHFCSEGKRFECPAGYYGDAIGLLNASCSGACAPQLGARDQMPYHAETRICIALLVVVRLFLFHWDIIQWINTDSTHRARNQ